MLRSVLARRHRITLTAVCALATIVAGIGCGGSGQNLFNYLGSPYALSGSTTTGGTPGVTGTTPGGSSSGATGAVDPCNETQARKFIRISMRNVNPDDYIQYFLVLVAYVRDTTVHPDGGVCQDDIALYTSFGYSLVSAGQSRAFGNYCFQGPALIYFHKNGQFKGAGSQGLASAIGPARGSTPTYDGFFTSAGAQVPVPDLILFHNPGTTTEGRALKVALSLANPCATGSTQIIADPACEQDSWYYVDENGIRAGSTVLGDGAYVRVPADIQGSGCECGLGSTPWAQLAQPGTIATTAACNEYLRGGRIDFAFLRNDTEPPFPQLVWRVSDSGGTRVHEFDSRAGIK